MSAKKIVAIGAGSDVFGVNMISTALRNPALKGSALCLVDRNEEAIWPMVRLAERANAEWGSRFAISGGTALEPALPGADFVVCSIAASPREALWRSDWEIPMKYGLRQPYAENSGPGGFAQAMRNIPMIMEIVRAMERRCPGALFINYTNPMIRICDAVNRYSSIKTLGLCHQIDAGYSMTGKALRGELGIEVSPDFDGTHSTMKANPARALVARAAKKALSIRAAGTNHFTWMLGLRDKKTGEDLLPLFSRRWRELEPDFEPLTRKIFELTGVFPIPGDEHLCEYLPWMSDPLTRPWERYSLSLYEWDARAARRESDRARILSLSEGRGSLATLLEEESEGAAEAVDASSSGCGIPWDALNIPNAGYIENLPRGAIVEVPGFFTPEGPKGDTVGALPSLAAELCRRELEVSRLCVDAAVQGDKKSALECLLLDPVMRDIETAERILEDYRAAYVGYFPELR
jgi:alpha-galactosidase